MEPSALASGVRESDGHPPIHTRKYSARPVRPRFPILGVGGALARPPPPDHCSAPIQPPYPPKPSASPPALLPELPELTKKRAPSAKPAITECQPTCPARDPRGHRTHQKCSQNDHFRTQKSSRTRIRDCVSAASSRLHKSRTFTLPPPSNWCGTPRTPKNITNGLRGRDSGFWVWGGGSLRAAWARDADAERSTHQTHRNRALAYPRSPPSCSNS